MQILWLKIKFLWQFLSLFEFLQSQGPPNLREGLKINFCSLVSRILATFEKRFLFEVFSGKFCLFWASPASRAQKPPIGSGKCCLHVFKWQWRSFQYFRITKLSIFLINNETFSYFLKKLFVFHSLFLVSVAKWAHLGPSSMLLHSFYGQINNTFSFEQNFAAFDKTWNFFMFQKFFSVS